MAQQPVRSGPKYRQIADDLRVRIESGEYPPGARLPTKAELMAQYHVALNTVARAVEELRRAGLVETAQGAGMFAREPTPGGEHSAEYVSLMAQLTSIGEHVEKLDERVAELEKAVHPEKSP
jgi:GntR family transcriptional regulator